MKFAICLVGLVVLALCRGIDSAPYQVLEPKEGHVPVYIREGDTPLAEINPELAEAFNAGDDTTVALKRESDIAALEDIQTATENAEDVEQADAVNDEAEPTIASFDVTKPDSENV